MLDWLIVGGGVHGMCVALHLRRRQVECTRIRILDPHPEPLAQWRQRARAVEMSELRSPAIHHVDPDPDSLLEFALASGKPLESTMTLPELQLFEAHAQATVDRAGLRACLLRGTAGRLERRAGGWRLGTEHGVLEARKVVLAIGSGDSTEWPEWARLLKRRGASVSHVLDADFRPRRSGRIAVIGGGMSAAQVALAAVARGQDVTWVVRNPLKVVAFDADWGWFGPHDMSAFHSGDPRRRGAILDRARHRGSVPPRLAQQLAAHVAEGRIGVAASPLARVAAWSSGIRLMFAAESREVDHVVLATGLERRMPGESWLRRSAEEFGLPRTPSGQPVPDSSLRWADGLYACGALAELELGPTARGIAGGRRAGELVARDA